MKITCSASEYFVCISCPIIEFIDTKTYIWQKDASIQTSWVCDAKKVWKYCLACSLVLMIQKKRLWQYRKNTFCLFWRKEIFCVPTSSFFLSVPFLNNHGGIAERSCFGKKIRKHFAFISFVRPRSCLQVCSV